MRVERVISGGTGRAVFEVQTDDGAHVKTFDLWDYTDPEQAAIDYAEARDGRGRFDGTSLDLSHG